MNKIMTDTLVATAKLALAGGVVFGIGFAFVTLDPAAPEKGTAEAEADIADFTLIPTTETQKFTAAMANLGLRPRRYDYNGNVLYFSSGYSKESPRELLHVVQEELVRTGVNEKNHAELKPTQQGLEDVRRFFALDNAKELQTDERADALWSQIVPSSEALLTGDVVPTKVSDNHLRMIGFDMNKQFESPKDLVGSEEMKRKRPVQGLMGGYKYFEAHWEDTSRTSAITAVWSDEDFDPQRMEGPGDSPPDPNVPPCIGCERDFRVQSLEPDEPFQANMFTTKSTVSETYEFYRSTMEQRGWRESGVQPRMQTLERFLPELREVNRLGRVLSLEKDGESLQLAILPDGVQRVNVLTNHEEGDAQTTEPHPDRKRGRD